MTETTTVTASARRAPGPARASSAAGAGCPLGDVGIIALVPDHWQDPWNTRKQVLTRLARFFQVCWMQPPAGWREALRSPLGRRPDGPYREPPPPGMVVLDQPAWLPEVYRPASAAAWLRRARVARAEALLRRRGAERLVLHVWRPHFAPSLQAFRGDLSCYHIDDEYTFSERERPNDPAEVALMRAVDQVFVTSPMLYDKKGPCNPHTVYAPNGVDYALYAAPHPEPPDLARVPRPRIGVVGVVKKELDLRMLADLAGRHPQWSFVFIGPRGYVRGYEQDLARLEGYPNVHFLGAKPLDQLAAYTQHLDVGALCYRNDDFNRFIFPLKLNEFLAAGRPVVGTPIPILRQFAGTITLAGSVERWGAALAQALSAQSNAPEQLQRRRAVAERFDWDKVTFHVARVLAARLGADYERRLLETAQGGGVPEPWEPAAVY